MAVGAITIKPKVEGTSFGSRSEQELLGRAGRDRTSGRGVMSPAQKVFLGPEGSRCVAFCLVDRPDPAPTREALVRVGTSQVEVVGSEVGLSEALNDLPRWSARLSMIGCMCFSLYDSYTIF